LVPDPFLAKAHIGNREGKLLPVGAQREHHPEKAEPQVNDQLESRTRFLVPPSKPFVRKKPMLEIDQAPVSPTSKPTVA